jgi:hypothetical protein
LRKNTIKDIARGRGRFILGFGPSGVFGHVVLLLEAIEPGQYSVLWHVESRHSSIERQQVEDAVVKYLQAYICGYPEYGLRVTVLEVISDEERQNDYSRAVYLAFRSALQEMGLPTPQIFAL